MSPATPALSSPVAPAVATRGTRIAVMNLAYVVKNYEKFKAFEKEMAATIKDFNEHMVAKRTQCETMKKEAETATSARREELEK